jgi:hypothetical protein
MKSLTKSLVQQIIEDGGNFECRSYSGRAMYGRACLAVEFDGNIGELVSELIGGTIGFENSEIEDVADAVRDMRLDSMGLGTVAYFPRIAFFDEDASDEGDDEEVAAED